MTLLDLFHNVALFDGLSENELVKVTDLCIEKQYAAGDIIIHQGDMGDELYIIQDGQVEIIVMGVRPERPIVILGKGQILGEMSLLDEGFRSATGRATVPTTVQMINGNQFTQLTEQDYHIGYIVMRNLAADLSFKLRHRNLATT
ncbi:MAG: cyclic nucleotide-binding domain-containing protein [Anaerolineales bacterium]|nr:cyclic nucleotide-binding domain-containing protein [Anaerolineales bacterium]